MSSKHCLFTLFILLLGMVWLSAQPLLTGELIIDNVQGYMISMHLNVTNIGDATFNHTFGDSELAFYSLDGIEHHEWVLPIVIPFSLEPGTTERFDLWNSYHLNSGPHTLQGYFNVPDDFGNPMAIGDPVTVIIGDSVPVTIGAGDELSRVPIDFFWRTTMYECIFTAEELNHTSGWITAISFYNNFSQEAFMNQDIRIYLASVPEQNLSANWISLNPLPFSSGTVDFPLGSNEIHIPLSYGIYYNGSDNMCLMVHRPIHASYQMGAEPFQVQAADPLRSRIAVSDNSTFHPLYTPVPHPNQHIGFMPKTTFYIIPDASENNDHHLTPPLITSSLYPNPVRSSCTFKVTSVQPESASIDIFNLRGQHIRTLSSAQKSTEHLLIWDTLDSKSSPSPDGIYLYRIISGQQIFTKKMILLRQ